MLCKLINLHHSCGITRHKHAAAAAADGPKLRNQGVLCLDASNKVTLLHTQQLAVLHKSSFSSSNKQDQSQVAWNNTCTLCRPKHPTKVKRRLQASCCSSSALCAHLCTGWQSE